MDREQITGANRGGVIVCILAGDESEGVDRSFESVAEHTGQEVPIVLAGSAQHREGAGEQRVIAGRAGLEEALADAAPADVVLVTAGTVVADGWLERLRAAASRDSRIATATGMTTGTGPVSVALPEPSRFEDAAAAVGAGSPRVRPRMAAAALPCVYIRRSALELVGGFGSLEQFSRRCLDAGLAHVLADDVLVRGDGAATRRPGARPDSRVARSLGSARRSAQGLSIVIDARNLGPRMDGTKLHVLELIGAVARPGVRRVQALVSEKLDAQTRGLLEAMPGVEPTTLAADATRSVRADVVHRPSQVDSPADLALLAQLADRLVLTQQDLIGYQNPSYFASPGAWHGYRTLTRRAMASADRVLFFSAHAREEALVEDLVTPDRASIVRIGVDHAVTRELAAEPVVPRTSRAIPDGADVAVCIGTDYAHKNRPFAIRMVAELQRRHGWRGRLVLAGPRMPFGSSAPEEARLLDADPELRELVLDIGEVSEAEKQWLLARSQLVLYPSVYEGFGLVPFEAADHGVPCLWAPGTALSELLPDSAAGIVPWDVGLSADRALALIRSGAERDRNLEALRAAADQQRWATAGARLIEVYRETCDGPPAPASRYERREGLMRGGFSEDAVRLVGPDGLLPRRLERPLLALASHPRLAKPVFGAIEAGYRVSKRRRRHSR